MAGVTDLISKNDMMGVLLAVCSSFEPIWNEFLAEWADEPDPPLCLALAALARHLIGMLQRGETENFSAIFTAVEGLHLHGDHFVREATTIGLFESLQNLNLHSSTKPEQFEPYLGPVSKLWWDKLNRFWDGDPTALRE